MYLVISRVFVYLFFVDICKVKWRIKIIIYIILGKMFLLKYLNNYGFKYFLVLVI